MAYAVGDMKYHNHITNMDSLDWPKCASIELHGERLVCVLDWNRKYDLTKSYRYPPHIDFLNLETDEDLMTFIRQRGPLWGAYRKGQQQPRIEGDKRKYWAFQRTIKAKLGVVDAFRSAKKSELSKAILECIEVDDERRILGSRPPAREPRVAVSVTVFEYQRRAEGKLRCECGNTDFTQFAYSGAPPNITADCRGCGRAYAEVGGHWQLTTSTLSTLTLAPIRRTTPPTQLNEDWQETGLENQAFFLWDQTQPEHQPVPLEESVPPLGILDGIDRPATRDHVKRIRDGNMPLGELLKMAGWLIERGFSSKQAFIAVYRGKNGEIGQRAVVSTLAEGIEWMFWNEIAGRKPLTFCVECRTAFLPATAHARKYCGQLCAHRSAMREWRERRKNQTTKGKKAT
jgi:hypothetical protein